MCNFLHKLWSHDAGQDIAEYAVMLAVILVLGVSIGTGTGQKPIRSRSDRTQPAQVKRSGGSAQTKRAVARKSFQVGTASWYGQQYDGKTTASGEPFDMYDLTAAHATLPLGTIVRVTNLSNGKTVIVRVNDRGSFATDARRRRLRVGQVRPVGRPDDSRPGETSSHATCHAAQLCGCTSAGRCGCFRDSRLSWPRIGGHPEPLHHRQPADEA